MIRTSMLILAAVLALMPTGATASSASTLSRCEADASREIDFTGAHARDTLDVSARGPDCVTSVVTVTLRKADGTPVMAMAVPLIWLHEAIDTSKPMTGDALQVLLQAYVTDAQLDTAGSTIPRWKKREPTPGFSQGLELTTPLDRTSYARLRATKPNMICIADIHEMGVCYVWDQRNARAEMMLRR